MSQTITVRNDAEAEQLIQKLSDRFNDFSPFFLRLGQTVMPEAALRQWGNRFGVGITHAPSTIEARKNREDYYGLAPERATPDWPYFEWTGALRRAAGEFTKITPTEATIDPDANYRGPIPPPDPFSRTVNRLISEQNIWDLAFLEPRIERALDEYVQEVASA